MSNFRCPLYPAPMPGNLWFAPVYSRDLELPILLTDLAVLSLNVEGEDTIELTKPTYLPSNQCDVNVALIGRLLTKVVIISRELRVNQTCESDRLAFCFHSWCYSVLKWVLKWGVEDSCIPVIYRLARALAPNPSM